MPSLTCPGCSRELNAAGAPPGTNVLCPTCAATLAPPTVSSPRADADPFATGMAPAATSAPRDARALPGYELLEELGRGGMGVVHKARQTALNRIVALKLILSGAHASEEELARFRTEAEAIARLRHPGIVQVYEVGEHDGKAFFSLEFCEGGGLDRKLAGTPMPAEDAARLVRSLAGAMQAAHDAGVVHRDLKPANVLLGADGAPKITDFGLAKMLDEAGQTQTGAVMGTPSYVAPEQAQGKKVGPAADGYALGAILYECLTGRPPFRAATAFDTMLQVINEEPAPPRQLNPKVPRDLETICLKCLRKEPEKRYASAKELGDDLGRFLGGLPIQARPVGPLTRAGKWLRRNPLAACLAASVFLALTAGLAVSLWQMGRANREAARAEEKAAEAQEHLKLAQQETARADQKAAEADRQKTRAERLRGRAEGLAYAGKLALAQAAFQEGDGAVALRHLDGCQWDRRGWEHRHLWTRFNSKQTFLGHGHVVTSVAYSPDGLGIASGSGDRTVRVWDAQTGQEVLRLEGHANTVRSVAFSPDGGRIASGSDDRTVRLWDARTGKGLHTLHGHADEVQCVAFSPDGLRIASAGRDEGLVRIWDARTGEGGLPLEGRTPLLYSVAYSPDGTRLVSGSIEATVRVRDARTGKGLLSLVGHMTSVHGVAYSPDGARIVSGSWDQTVRVWDARTGKGLLTLGHSSVITSVACSPDGGRIVSGNWDGTVRVRDARTGRQVFSLKGHRGQVYGVAFSPDGRRIASGGTYDLGRNSTLGEVRVWDAERGQEVLALEGHADRVSCAAFSPDGRRIVSASEDRTVRVWDAERGQEVRTLRGHAERVTSAAYSPDGGRIASGSYDGTVRVWDARTGEGLLTLQGPANSVLWSVAFSPDGGRIVGGAGSGGREGAAVVVWDARTGLKVFSLEGHKGNVAGAAFSPDGGRIVSGSFDRTVRVWDARDGRELLRLEGHVDRVAGVAFSPDGARIVSGGWDHVIRVWDARTGKSLFALDGHTGGVYGVAYSPDGKRIVSGGFDRTVRVWDAERGQEVLTLEGHADRVAGVAFSRDGGRVVSASNDRTVRVWDAAKRQAVRPLEGHASPVVSTTYSRDGKRLFAWDAGKTVLAWSLEDGLPAEPVDPPAPRPGPARSPDGFLLAEPLGPLVAVTDSRLADPTANHWPLPAGAERRRHHGDQARLAEARKEWFAAVFHLDRLLALSPQQRPELLKRRSSALAAALKSAPDDPWPARALARQAVADHASIGEPKPLLSALARHSHAAVDRLYGALLLRTGNARDAAVVLRAAIRNRQPDEPPIDELLLALALVKLDRRGEARRLLASAAAWMDRATTPLRAASLLAARSAGPLAALTAFAHDSPDVRLNPLDPFTAHDLAALRAEAERALGARR